MQVNAEPECRQHGPSQTDGGDETLWRGGSDGTVMDC
jgi:hypothetical protein